MKNNDKIQLDRFVTEAFPSLFDIKEFNKPGHEQPFLHWHPHYEIHVIRSGICTTVSNTLTLRTDKPVVFLHAPYSLHSGNAEPEPRYRCFIVAFDRRIPSMFTKEMMDMSLFGGSNLVAAYPTPEELDDIWNICDHMKRHMNDVVLCAHSAALLMHIISQIAADGRSDCRRSSFSYIQVLLCHIGGNLSEPITIPAMAQKYEVSESKLARDFKSVTGMTYKKYLTSLRLTRAREMLLAGENIIRTSMEMGYSSEAHFVKAFREYWGVTPGEYLRKSREVLH